MVKGRRQKEQKSRTIMLFMVVSLLCWTQTKGGSCGTIVSISGNDRVLPAGGGFNLSCEFKCLRPQHVAQLWRDSGNEVRVSLVNITSFLPNVIVSLNISSATKEDAGYYSCMTHPPDTISPQVLIQIADNLTASSLTTPSTPQCGSCQQHSSTAGLFGQIWYWILLGKAAILLLCFAALAVKYKRG